MIGIVLWYNPRVAVGIVWCEDQGPLAYVGPDLAMPSGTDTLQTGDRVVVSTETCDDVRYVRDIFSVIAGASGQDPREILAEFHGATDVAAHLRVVA